MSSTMHSSRLHVGILTLLLLVASVFATREVITTISGKRVPIEFVQRHFDKKLSSSDTKNFLYEVNDHVLRGSDLFLDLRSDALPVQAERTLASTTVVLNGVSKDFSSETLRTVRVKSYSVIIDVETDEVQAITGNGIVLTPLHSSQFPGVFVNKMALSDPRRDLASDLRILGKGRNHRVSEVSSPIAVRENVEILERVKDVNTVGDVTTRQTRGSCASGTTHYLEVAVAYDNTFCALYDNKENVATTALKEVVDKANGAYASNTCIQLALVHVEAHCDDQNDPYKGFQRFSPGQILNNFERIWVQSRENIKRDSAYLVTGFQDGTSVAGIAYIAAACSNRNGYGWVEGPSAIIFAHEVGHTLGGQHTASGIMGPVATGGTLPSFSAQSVQQFTSYIDSYPGSACIETSRPSGAPRGTSPPATTAAEPQTPAATQEPASPTNEPEPNLPPIVNEPRVTTGGKCRSGFTSSNALSCNTQTLRMITFSGGGAAVGEFKTSLQQRNGQFVVQYRVTDQLYISKYRELVTTDRGIVGSAKGDFKTPRGSTKKVDSTWNANRMPRPAGQTTCCGNNLYIASEVSVCIKTNSGMELCQTISETYTTRITCTNACQGNSSGQFTAMSAGQECPSCT